MLSFNAPKNTCIFLFLNVAHFLRHHYREIDFSCLGLRTGPGVGMIAVSWIRKRIEEERCSVLGLDQALG